MFDIRDLRPGDVFRTGKDQKYCYGVIMARVRPLKEKCGLKPGHSLLAYQNNAFFYRLYQIRPDSPALTVKDLAAYLLGPTVICDRIFEEENFTVIGRIAVTEDLLAFPLLAKGICFVAAHSQVAFMDAIGPEDPYWDNLLGISLEWGTACVQLANKHISPEIRMQIKNNCLCAYHSTLGIHSGYAKTDKYNARGSLILPDEIDTVRALFPCFGLAPEADFDGFAEKWGGMSKSQLLELIIRDQDN